jgi:hypothetical protein
LRRIEFRHEFVEAIPRELTEGVLYISIPYATAAHLCFCGCGSEINTPLSPTDWRLIFDGRSVSLYPSIGNWSVPCRSHYWLEHSRVHHAPAMSAKKIAANRARDRRAKDAYFGEDPAPLEVGGFNSAPSSTETSLVGRLVRRHRDRSGS